MRAWHASILAAGFIGLPGEACAQSEFIGPEAFDVALDLRASAVSGETGWIDGGFGKLRYGGDDGEAAVRARIASADLAWKPQIGWNVSGLVSLTWQPDLPSDEFGLSEAFVKFRSGPAATRFSARAGVFWPPISQEHAGSNWQVTDTITPSAANSWVGEEVKVLGLEASVESAIADHELTATGAVFRHNDMSGTLLSYRGWALHDVRVTTNAELPLPPLSRSRARFQDQITSPFWEVDDKVGFYGRVDWRPPLPLALNAFYYDNRGDRVSTRAKQTSWRTTFWNVGATATLDGSTTAGAQLMWGNTLVGPDRPLGIPVDVDFTTAYLLVSHEMGPGKVTVRGDWFETHDNSYVQSDNNNEHGWAAAAAYKAPLYDHAELIVEVLHVSSDRPARQFNAGVAARQEQTILQTSVRFSLQGRAAR